MGFVLGFSLGSIGIAAVSIPVIEFVQPHPFVQAPPRLQSPIIRVIRTQELLPDTRDPVWSVQLVVDGEVEQSLPALIGRANRQNHNRHTTGNKSPLPPGDYIVDRRGIEMGPFPDPEVGNGYWIPISPLFKTGRSALGIHQDPSWGKLNGESGTSGCIGLESAEQTKQVVQWIKQHGIGRIVVES